MKTLVQDGRKLPRGVGCGEVGPSCIADEESVFGEDCLGRSGWPRSVSRMQMLSMVCPRVRRNRKRQRPN